MPTTTPYASPVAQLLVGTPTATVAKAQEHMHTQLCKNEGCTSSCFVVEQLKEKKHPFCFWLSTQKGYTLDDIDVLKQKMSFVLDEHEQFFFIIERAELLSIVCTNALLKSIEEPPAGYFFMLLTATPQALLATLRSRCLIFYIPDTQEEQLAFATLYAHFTTAPLAPALFLQELERSKINEEETEHLFKQIIAFWQTEYKKAATEQSSTYTFPFIEKKLNVLYRFIPLLPTASNAKLFWKGVYLQCDTVVNGM